MAVNVLIPVDQKKVHIKNPDGTFSTERSITVSGDGKSYLIPTIVNGKEYSPDEAIKLFESGKNLPLADSDNEEELNQYAKDRTSIKGKTQEFDGSPEKPSTLPNPVLPDDLPSWVTEDPDKKETPAKEDALPDWVLNDPKPSKDDDISDIINDPIDERHVMLSTGLFRAVDKDGHDKEPTGEFFVVPTPEAAKSGVYRNNKLFKEYNPEFEWSEALPAVGDLIGSTAKGIVKMSGPNQVYKLATEGPAGTFKQGVTNIMGAAEGAAQGGEFAKDVIGNIASYGAKKFQPDDQEDAYQYEKDVQDIIKKKSTEGQTTIGKAVRALSGDENSAGAQLADQLIDKDIATAAGIFADPVFAVTGPGKYLKGLVMAKDATKIARIAELTSENAAKMSLKEARDLAIKQVQSETPLMVKNISDIQGIAPVVKGISELIPEGARRFGSIAKTAIENPSATVMQGAGKALRGASNAVIKAADWALGPGTVPALARGAAGLYTSGPLGAIAAMALGDSPKLRGIVHGGKVFATLGDLLDTAGSAIKGGGDAKALRTAGMNASEAGTREAAARAAGLNPEITDTSKLRVLKSPLLRVANFVGGDVVDPALRGAALGAGFNAAAGEDPSSGVLPGAFYGLAGHGFGSFGKLLSGGQRDPVTSAKFATQFLNSLDPETLKIWRRQDPRAIDFFGDVDFMVRAANDRMAKINGKPAIQIKYAGTPQEVREAYLASQDGQADQAELKDAHAKAQDTSLSPAQRLQSMQQIQALNDRINKSSRASGWVAPTPEGGLQMVINASTDLNPGQISHEALGHVLDQIDFATDREGKNNPLRDAREEMLSALFGTEPSGVPGEPEPVKGQYSEQDLQNMAERYFAKLGRSPRLETDAQGNATLSAEDRQTMLKELVAEHSNLFTQNARTLGKDAVQHALDVVNGTDEDVASMLQESGSQSNLFAADGAGRVITNDVPTERAAAERILSLVEASAAPDATLRITKDGVEIPQSAPITRSQLSTEAKKAHENYDLAQTYDEAVKARQAKDAIADSIIYQTAAKPPKVAQAEASKEFELKTGRKPSKPELQAAAAEIMAESPRVVVNNRKEVYSPGDTPILLTKKEQEDAAKDLGKTVKVALAGIPAEEGAMVLKVGPDGKEYMDGAHFSDAQIKALRAVPNAVLPKSIKDTVIDFNRTMRKGGGTLKDFIYHQAMKRQGNIPRSFRSVSPFSFGITKADNILVRSWDVTNIYRKLEKEGAKRQSNTLEPFREPDETDYGQAVERFAGSLRQFGQNHSEGKLGSVGLHPDEKKAYDRADAIAKFLGFGKDRNVDLDSMDSEKANSFTRSFRIDRMFNVKDSLADPLKLDYRKTKENLYMPEHSGMSFMPEVVEETKDYTGLHYNGSQETPSGPLHYFTDSNEDSPAHGGTFTVLGQVTPEAVESARQKQVERFSDYMPEESDPTPKVIIQDQEIQTGSPVTFKFLHNRESATDIHGKPKKGGKFDREFEPSGRYVTDVADPSYALANFPDKFDAGTITLSNPLVINVGTYGDSSSWKRKLSSAYKATGKKLSKAIIADGYDGVITESNGRASEILDLTTFDENKARYMPDMQDDSLAQTAYMNMKAKEMGLGTAKDMPYEKFVELAQQWRHTNPRDENGNFTGSYEFPKAFSIQGQEQGDSPENARKLIGGRGDAYLRDEQKTLRRRTSRGYYRASIEPIVKWAKDSGRVFNSNLLDLAYGGGQEHEVILTPKRILKVTMPDRAGLTIDWNDKDQHPEIAPARPEEYLERMALSNELFGDDFRLEGIMPRGESTSLVISQPLYRGQHPSSQEVVQYFEEGGFLPMGNDRRFYNPEENIAIFDAKPSNMIVSEKGILPLDVIVLKPEGKVKEWILKEMDIASKSEQDTRKQETNYMPESDALPDWVLNDQPESIGTAKAQEDDDKLPDWVLQD